MKRRRRKVNRHLNEEKFPWGRQKRERATQRRQWSQREMREDIESKGSGRQLEFDRDRGQAHEARSLAIAFFEPVFFFFLNTRVDKLKWRIARVSAREQ
jgi:hypothetical protein